MRFLSMYKSSKQEGTPPTQQEMERMGKLIEDMTKSGVLLSAEGCLPSAKGARIRLSSRKIHLNRRAIHRGEGNRRWLCADQGEFQGGSHRAHQDLP